MDNLSLLIEYIYLPLALALYALHIKYVKLDTKVQDYIDFKKDIYTTLTQIKLDLHHLVETKKDIKK